jgi:transposase-like protein
MAIDFGGHRFEKEIILLNVRWKLAYPLSYRDLEEMMAERGVTVDHTSIYRWVIKFTPFIEAAVRRAKRPVGTSWRLDETYVKVSGQWKYLYRAVDKDGNTIDFLLTAKRDQKAAKRFLTKAVKLHGAPVAINIDKSGANAAAIKAFGCDGYPAIKMRQNKYLNNIVEQDHRGIKRMTKLSMGFKSFRTARITLGGIEVMRMIRKRQVKAGGKTPAEIFYALVV